MDTYRVGPNDFPIEHELLLFRATFPAGMLYEEGPEMTRFYPAPTDCHAEYRTDSRVKLERVGVLHTRVLNGGAGQPQLVQPYPGRLCGALDSGNDVELVEPQSEAAQGKYPKWKQPAYEGE